MTIETKRDGSKLYAAVIGRIDTVTVTEAENILKSDIGSVTELTLDFKEINYISSAGLRLLLSLQKLMNTQGSMKVINVNPTVMEIFEVTGFSEMLTIE